MHSDQYADDSGISDDATLWRFIRPEDVISDKNLERRRPTSACFSASSDGTPMSVLLADAVRASGRSASDLLAGKWAGCCIVSFTAGFVRRELGLGVTAFPAVQDEPAHAWVFGKMSKSVKSRLAKSTVWVIGPPPEPQ